MTLESILDTLRGDIYFAIILGLAILAILFLLFVIFNSVFGKTKEQKKFLALRKQIEIAESGLEVVQESLEGITEVLDEVEGVKNAKRQRRK